MNNSRLNVPATERTTVRQLPERGAYDRETIEAIVDEALICHVGFVVDRQPYVIPMIHARDGERLLFHGAAASRMLRVAGDGVPLCVTITLLDGLVLARSAFNHSMNYRSVVILGKATEVIGHSAKLAAMRTLVEHVVSGRWDDVRHPSEEELDATRILTMPIDEASAKIRTGPPVDAEADYALRIWAGEIPLGLIPAAPSPDPHLDVVIETPRYALRYARPGREIDSE